MWRIVLLLLMISNAATAADRVVIVTATTGFRHESIETAEQVLSDIAARTGWYDITFARNEEEMAAALSAEALKTAKMVMFVNTTGDLPRRDLLEWLRQGGSFIGVHGASDTLHGDPDYIEMLGGEFDHHPAETIGQVFVDDRTHPATAVLEAPYVLFEEFYLFKNFASDRVRVLLSLRASPEDGVAGFFPLAWYRSYGNGRVFYTALGHRSDVWNTPWFQQHLTGAIAWGLRRDLLRRRHAVTR